MKKIYFFLLAMFGLLFSTNIFAQEEPDYGWEVDEAVVTMDNWEELLYSPFSDSVEGTDLSALVDESTSSFWHTDWHGEVSYSGNHYLQIMMPDWVTEETELAMRFTRRSTDNDHTIEWSIRGTNEDVEWSAEESCEELLYASTPFSSNTETLMTETFSTKGYKYIRIYSENTYGKSASFRKFWHVSELNLYTLRKRTLEEYVEEEKNKVLEEYAIYQGTFVTGTTPGCYGEAEVEEFDAALEALYALDEPGAEMPSQEELLAMLERVKVAYEAVLASLVTTAVPDGYYRIRSAMIYYNDVATGEKDEEGNDITEPWEGYKYMMGHKQNGKLWGIWASPDWGGEAVESECRKLWKITNKDGFYDMVSMYNDARFMDVARSTSVEMSLESENLMAIETAGADVDGNVMVNFRVSTQPSGDYLYLHQNGHSNGTGVNGFLVGWCNTVDQTTGEPGATEWVLEPVDEEEALQIIADYEPYKDVKKLVDAMKELSNTAKEQIVVAKDVQKIWDNEDDPLIKDVSQLSSPYTEPSEGALEYLLDGDLSNFWHSIWSSGSVPGGTHYLQVEIVDDDVTTVAFKGYRRNADNDHTTKWSVYGSDDEDLDNELGKEGCDSLATFETPFNKPNEYIEGAVFDTKGHKYLRFYSEEETGPSYGTRGYWHMAEFQLYRAHEYQSETCQYNVLGDIVKNLEAAIEEVDAIDTDEAEMEELQAAYNKLKAAYESFAEKFVDPAELRQAMADATEMAEGVAVGKDPGFWPSTETADALNKMVADAKTYDESGAYTPAKSDEFLASFEALGKACEDAVIKIQEGKWYRVRFGTEDEYEKYGWDYTGSDDDINDEGTVVNEAIFGKYMTLATQEDNDGVHSVIPVEAEDVVMNDNLYFDDDDDIMDKDLSLFRFVAVGDSAYMIQSKATGLFLKAAGTTGRVALSVQPSLFTQKALGLGANLLEAKHINGAGQSNLHFARNWNVIETWGATEIGSRSSLFIETAGDVAADYNVNDFKIDIVSGALNTFCYPMGLKANEGQMYGVSGVELVDGGAKVSFVKIAEAAAGRPFIFVSGNLDDYDSETEPDAISFTHDMNLVAEADTNSVLRGDFVEVQVGQGVIQASGNKFTVTKSSVAKASANTCWIAAEEKLDKKATITIDITDGEDGIASAIRNVSRRGDIYTIDGRYMGKGNLNSLEGLGRGVYIINGTKVTVK